MRSLAAYFSNRRYPLHTAVMLAVAWFATTSRGALFFGEGAFVVSVVFTLAASYFITAPLTRWPGRNMP